MLRTGKKPTQSSRNCANRSRNIRIITSRCPMDFTFDPARPTSLLYKKTKTGYDLIGAMYTMPKRVTEEQLNSRVPLSVAQWHLHTKLCMPPKEQRGHADLVMFSPHGSIADKQAC